MGYAVFSTVTVCVANRLKPAAKISSAKKVAISVCGNRWVLIRAGTMPIKSAKIDV